MNVLQVDTQSRKLIFHDEIMDCALGRSGACPSGQKQEGDGCTPLGRWPIRTVFFRPGRSLPSAAVKLPWRWVGGQDGWSDDPSDPSYNRPVRLPHSFSAENLVRDDPLYDVIVALGHNDAPPDPGKGSAIFLHIWNDAKPTEGCVAIARSDMDRLLPQLMPDDIVEIS